MATTMLFLGKLGVFLSFLGVRLPLELVLMCFFGKKSGMLFFGGGYKVGPLPAINGVITPISRVITPVTHL